MAIGKEGILAVLISAGGMALALSPTERANPIPPVYSAGAPARIDPMPDCYPCGPEDEKPGPADPDPGDGRNGCAEGENCP